MARCEIEHGERAATACFGAATWRDVDACARGACQCADCQDDRFQHEENAVRTLPRPRVMLTIEGRAKNRQRQKGLSLGDAESSSKSVYRPRAQTRLRIL